LNKIAVITPVPDVIDIIVKNSIIRKAVEKDIIDFRIVHLRNYGIGNYKKIDDAPFGGGSGMVMMPGPLIRAVEDTILWMDNVKDIRIIYPSPQGVKWKQNLADKFSHERNIIIICGHYKGIDERVIKKYVTDEYSIGDFIMTSGEIPAMIILDSIVRLIPGTLNNLESALTDTFSNTLLDHPHYTQPRTVCEMNVPEILLGGNHEKIESWRKEQRKIRTKNRRPDIWKKYIQMKEMENKHE